MVGKPKPSALKVLQGTDRPDRANPAEPKPRRTAPTCPMWLEKEARREWRKLAPELVRIGLLTAVDGPAFAAFCQTFARYQQAELAGDLAKIRVYLPLLRPLLTEFGLTPAARARLAVTPAAPSDPMEALLD
jgi:phage terminase small subunit